MQIRSGKHLATTYETLSRLEPGLLLDVGAAVGGTAHKMQRAPPDSTVIAFEPNPANWPHFEKRNGANPNIQLMKAALSNEQGAVKFASRHSISGDDPRWAKYAGGSSIGRVQDDGDIDIPAITLDDVLGDRTALFCKIDVQGFEPKVLQGARRAISERRIKFFLIEFMLYDKVLSSMQDYIGYDQEWLVIPRTNTKLPPDLASWDLTNPRNLSIGKTAYSGWPKTHPEDIMKFQKEQNAMVGRCWTDLLFIAPDFVDRYLAANKNC